MPGGDVLYMIRGGQVGLRPMVSEDSWLLYKWFNDQRVLENIKRAYETYPGKTFIARTPLIPGVNDDEEHVRAVLAFIRPYKNVIDYELLPYMRFGEGKYGFLGRIYEMQDFNPPAPEILKRLRVIIDEAFGRSGKSLPAAL